MKLERAERRMSFKEDVDQYSCMYVFTKQERPARREILRPHEMSGLVNLFLIGSYKIYECYQHFVTKPHGEVVEEDEASR